MTKSLTPFIVFFSFIILLTVVLINMQSGKKESSVRKQEKHALPSMSLSPFSGHRNKRFHKSHETSSEMENPDLEKLKNDAYRFLRQGKTENAINCFKTFLLFRPNDFSVVSELAMLLCESGHYGEAEFFVRRQIELKPENPVFYNNLGEILARQRKMKEALRATEKAIELNPENERALLNASGIYSVRGEKSKALDALKKAVPFMDGELIPLLYDPTFDNIRNEPEFESIVRDAEKTGKHRTTDNGKN